MVGGFNFNLPLRELREEVEWRYFEYHIAQEGQNMSKVAQNVGLERTHLYRKLKQLGIGVSRRAGEKPKNRPGRQVYRLRAFVFRRHLVQMPSEIVRGRIL